MYKEVLILKRATYIADEVTWSVCDVLGEAEVDLGDAAVRVIVRLGLERRFADEELVAEHAHTPQVDLLIVKLSFNHLWWKVVECAAQCRTSAKTNTINAPKIPNSALKVKVELST